MTSRSGARPSPIPSPNCISTASTRYNLAARWAMLPAWFRAAEFRVRLAQRAQQAQRARQSLADNSEVAPKTADASDAGKAAVDKSPAIGKALGAVFEPVQHGRGVDACQSRALCVKTKVGGSVTGGIPHRVHRVVNETGGERRVVR